MVPCFMSHCQGSLFYESLPWFLVLWVISMVPYFMGHCHGSLFYESLPRFLNL